MRVLVSLAVLTLGSSAVSQERLLIDINTNAPRGSSYPRAGHTNLGPIRRAFLTVGSWHYYTASHATIGRELCRTDGTAAKTKLVADLEPGTGGSDPDYLLSFGGKVFFVATTSTQGTQLYVTDPANNKVTLLPSRPYASAPVVAMGAVYFACGGELWRTDGSVPGTVKILSSFRSIRPLTSFKNELYLRADDGKSGSKLWKTNGTQAGTLMLGGGKPWEAVEFNGLLYFTVENSWGPGTMWSTDGTVAGTKFFAGGSPHDLTVYKNRLYYIGFAAAYGQEIFWNDGKNRGVLDLRAGTKSSDVAALTVTGGALLFTCDAPDPATGKEIGAEPWRFDGTKLTAMDLWQGATGTNGGWAVQVGSTTFFMGWYRFGSYGRLNRVKFVLWARDATGSVVKLMELDDEPFVITPTANKRVLFNGQRAYAPYNGVELWSSDGTQNGTYEVLDFNPGGVTGDSHPTQLFPIGDRLAFTASEGFQALVFLTDGTKAGTKMVAGFDPRDYFQFGDKVMFMAHGGTITGQELGVLDLKTDKISFIDVNRGPLHSNPSALTIFRGKVYFCASGNINFGKPGTAGRELWYTDGTWNGTHLAVDLVPGSGSSNPSFLTVFRGRLYFNSQLGLMRSDGTLGGTKKVGATGSNLTATTGLMFYQGIAPTTRAPDLWVSDGTTAGTRNVGLDIPWNNALYTQTSDGRFRTLGDRVIFSTNARLPSGSFSGWCWWISDGTKAGTVPLRDGSGKVLPAAFVFRVVVAGDLAFFESNGDLMQTDGKKTIMLAPKIQPKSMIAVGSRVFFVSTNRPNQWLWQSDGTVAGTTALSSGSKFTKHTNLAVMGGKLLFSAHGLKGQELCELDLGAYAIHATAGTSDTAVPRLRSEPPILGRSYTVRIDRAANSSLGFYGLGYPAYPLVFFGDRCQVVIDYRLPSIALPFRSDATGAWSKSFAIPNNPALKGLIVSAQAVLGPTTTQPFGLDWTNGIYLHVGDK